MTRPGGGIIGAAMLALCAALAPVASAERFRDITFHHRGDEYVRVKVTAGHADFSQQFTMPSRSSKTMTLPDLDSITVSVVRLPATDSTAENAAARRNYSSTPPADGRGLPILSDIFSFTDLVLQTASPARNEEMSSPMEEEAVISRPGRSFDQALAIGGLDVRISATSEPEDACWAKERTVAAARRDRARLILAEARARADVAGLDAAMATEAAFLAQAEARLADITQAPDEGGAFSEDVKASHVTTRELRIRSSAGRNAWTDYRAGRINSDELLRRWKSAGEESATLILRERDAALREAERKAAQDSREMARRKADQTRALRNAAEAVLERRIAATGMQENMVAAELAGLMRCEEPPTTLEVTPGGGAWRMKARMLLQRVIDELDSSSFSASPRGRELLHLAATFLPGDVTVVVLRDKNAGGRPTGPMHPTSSHRSPAGNMNYVRNFFSEAADGSELEEEFIVELDASEEAIADADRRPKEFMECVIDGERLVAPKQKLVQNLARSAVHAAQAGRYHVSGRRCIEQEVDAWRAGNEACRALGLAESPERPGQSGRSNALSNPLYRPFEGWR